MNNDGKDDGGQAFPRAGSTGMTARPGMTLRDWFAGKVLPEMIVLNGNGSSLEFNVACAYGYADAMIKFRGQGE